MKNKQQKKITIHQYIKIMNIDNSSYIYLTVESSDYNVFCP